MKYLQSKFKVCPGYSKQYRDNYERTFGAMGFEKDAEERGCSLCQYKGQWYWADDDWNWFGPYDYKSEAVEQQCQYAETL